MLLIMLLTYAAILGYLHLRDSNQGLLHYSEVIVFIFPELEIRDSWKERYISKMNFINPELNFLNKIRKIKTRDIHTSKKEILK
jgi:hypothetical protein